MEIPYNDNKDRFDCNLCGINNIHKNDFNNHVRSRKHIRNARNLEEKNNPSEKRTPTEDVSNLKDKFQKLLVKSINKKNVRKLKKIRRSSFEDDQRNITDFPFLKFSDQSKDESLHYNQLLQPDEPEEKFFRKKYKVRPDCQSFEQIDNYVYSIVSYLSMKLSLDSSIHDFLISVNVKEYQSFGDIVINVVTEENSTVYAIKCKQISTKSLSSVKDANINILKEYKYIENLKKQRQIGLTKFLIFTTCNTTADFQRQAEYIKRDGEITKFNLASSNKFNIINVSNEKDSVFSIFSENHDLESYSFYLYTNQKVFLPIIDGLLRKYFATFPSIFKEYFNYIESWATGALGGNYCVNKNDVILKIGELLLQSYIVLPKIINFKQDNFEAWNNIIKKVDVIIIKNEPLILTKLCEPFIQFIETTLSEKFDSVTKTITITKEVLEKNDDPRIKAYLFEETEDLESAIHYKNIYRVFWKAGKIPLLLSLEKNEDSKHFIFEVILFMKRNGVNKKFLLKSEDPLLKKPPGNLTIFSSLIDITNYVNLNEIKIKITKDFSLSLEQIRNSDPFFLQWVTPSILIDMVLDRYSLRKNVSSGFDIQSDLKIVLNEETIQKIHNLLYGCPCESENMGRLQGVNPTVF